VDLPTDGNPIRHILAFPYFYTSNPSPFGPDLTGSNNSERNLANLAFNCPKWNSVALFFYVLPISSSIALIRSIIPILNNI